MNKSQKQKYVIIIVAVCCLLFFSDGIALNLIASPLAPDVVAIVAVTVAVVLVIMMYFMAFAQKRKGVFSEIPNVPVVGAVKESIEAPVAVISPVNIQKSAVEVESSKVKQKNASVKQVMMPLGKLICPACRKVFTPPFFVGDFMVNYGPSSLTKKVVLCPYCGQSINLKQVSTVGDIWE